MNYIHHIFPRDIANICLDYLSATDLFYSNDKASYQKRLKYAIDNHGIVIYKHYCYEHLDKMPGVFKITSLDFTYQQSVTNILILNDILDKIFNNYFSGAVTSENISKTVDIIYYKSTSSLLPKP